MRAWRLVLLILAGVLAAAASTVLAVAVNVATGGTARWFPAVERHPLWWTAGVTVAVAGAGLLVWLAQRWYDRGLAELVPAVQRPPAWVVGPARRGPPGHRGAQPRGDGGDHDGGAGGGGVREDHDCEDGPQ